MTADAMPIGYRAAIRMLRPVHMHLLVGAALAGTAAAAGLMPYIAISEIARSILDGSVSHEMVWVWFAVGAMGAFLRLVCQGLDVYVGHHADAKMLHELRVRIVNRLGVVPLGWFRAAGSGQVKKVMTVDLEAMHVLFAHALAEVVAATAATVVAVGYLVSVDVPMAVVAVAVPLASLLAYRLAMRSMPKHTARLIAAEGRISGATVEYVDGVAVTKTFGAATALDRYDAAVRDYRDAFRTWVGEVRYSTAVSHVLAGELTVLTVVLLAGIGLVSAGRLAMPDLVPFLVVGVGLATPLMQWIGGTIALRSARVAAGHIDRLLAVPPLPEPDRPRTPERYGVEFDRVTFSYGAGDNAVEDISFRCEPGTVTALVGPSGAGKSTLAALLPRFYDVTEGAIRIGAVDIREIPSSELLSAITLVFQDVILLRDTISENIRLGSPSASDDEVREAAKAAQIHDVIMKLPRGYDTVMDEAGGAGLSGGERQRLTIARAILAQAPIVVLDEATAALDPDNEAAVQDALAELIVGKTVIVIAHRLHTIVNADQIVVLDNGRVVETGCHVDLLRRRGRYAQMWDAQLSGAAA